MPAPVPTIIETNRPMIVTMPESLHRRFKSITSSQGYTMASIVRRMVRAYVEHHTKDDGQGAII